MTFEKEQLPLSNFTKLYQNMVSKGVQFPEVDMPIEPHDEQPKIVSDLDDVEMMEKYYESQKEKEEKQQQIER